MNTGFRQFGAHSEVDWRSLAGGVREVAPTMFGAASASAAGEHPCKSGGPCKCGGSCGGPSAGGGRALPQDLATVQRPFNGSGRDQPVVTAGQFRKWDGLDRSGWQPFIPADVDDGHDPQDDADVQVRPDPWNPPKCPRCSPCQECATNRAGTKAFCFPPTPDCEKCDPTTGEFEKIDCKQNCGECVMVQQGRQLVPTCVPKVLKKCEVCNPTTGQIDMIPGCVCGCDPGFCGINKCGQPCPCPSGWHCVNGKCVEDGYDPCGCGKGKGPTTAATCVGNCTFKNGKTLVGLSLLQCGNCGGSFKPYSGGQSCMPPFPNLSCISAMCPDPDEAANLKKNPPKIMQQKCTCCGKQDCIPYFTDIPGNPPSWADLGIPCKS